MYFRIKISPKKAANTPTSRFLFQGPGQGRQHSRAHDSARWHDRHFNGKAFDKTIVKARGREVEAKTFTLSDVQPGSILEYYYTTDFSEDSVFESHWMLNHELFTKSAKFSLNPYDQRIITG